MAAGFSPVNSRKLPIIIGLIGMAVFTFLAAEAPSNVMAIACISGTVFCDGGSSGMSWARRRRNAEVINIEEARDDPSSEIMPPMFETAA